MLVSAIGKFNSNIAVQSTFKSMPTEQPIITEPLPPTTEETDTKLDLIA